MSNTDVLGLIIPIIQNAFIEFAPLIAGLAGLYWVIRLLITWVKVADWGV